MFGHASGLVGVDQISPSNLNPKKEISQMRNRNSGRNLPQLGGHSNLHVVKISAKSECQRKFRPNGSY